MAWNEQADQFLQAAAAQSLGSAPIAKQLYDGVIQEAGEATVGEKVDFLNALTARIIDTRYTDAAWADKYGDLFFTDSEQFGAIVQIINVEMPQVRENRAWDQIVSGQTTIGSNVVYFPVVKEQLVGGTSSWALPYALTGTQLNAAFTSTAGLQQYEARVVLAADNGVKYHLQRMTSANRNNYMMEKLAKGNTASNINVVNLVAEYNAYTGRSLTAQQFLNNTDGCLRFVNKTFKKYKALLTDMTTLFTLDPTTTGKFIPDDRFTFSVISDFAGLLESELYSTTYHDNFVTLKGYREVPSWQALRSASSVLSFDDLTSIYSGREESVLIPKTESDRSVEINKAGVVGLMCDKWAIMHTIVRRRTGVQRDDIKDITLFEHQFTDRYFNNLMLPGIVFTIEDVH